MPVKNTFYLLCTSFLIGLGCSAVQDAVGDDIPGEAQQLADSASEQVDSDERTRESSDDGDDQRSAQDVTEDVAESASSASDSDVAESASGSVEDFSRDAQNTLTMCQSNTNSAVRHAEELHEDLAGETDPPLHDHDIHSKIQRIEGAEDCVEGEDAEKIENMPGYGEVEDNWEQASRLLDEYRTGAEQAEQERFESARAEGLGDDNPQQRRERWRERPRRCIDGDEWNEAAGIDSQDESDTATIHGADDVLETDDRMVPESVFSNNRFSYREGPYAVLVRHSCGKDVQGVDDYYRTEDQNFGSQITQREARSFIGDVVRDDSHDDHLQTLYQAVAAHLCWTRTSWNLETGYSAYLYCRDIADDLPAQEDVEEAMTREFPDFQFEQDNMRFMYQQALEAKEEVDAAFAQLEEQYPVMREVYRDSAERAEEVWRRQQREYADIIDDIEPITELLLDDVENEPPANCLDTTESARAQLADEIDVQTPEDVRQLRIGHPVGYQVTEAMAYCHLHEGNLAQASLEAHALDEGMRRVTLGENIAVERRRALHEVEQRHEGDEEAIAEEIPFYELRHNYSIPLPGDTHRSPSFFGNLNYGGGMRSQLIGGPESDDDDSEQANIRFRQIGQRNPQQRPVIESIQDHRLGQRVVFVTETETRMHQQRECERTDRVEGYRMRGNRVEVEYEQRCRNVGEPRQVQVEHQYDPVVLPDDQADVLRPNMRVEVLNNNHRDADDDDTVLKRAWDGDELVYFWGYELQ